MAGSWLDEYVYHPASMIKQGGTDAPATSWLDSVYKRLTPQMQKPAEQKPQRLRLTVPEQISIQKWLKSEEIQTFLATNPYADYNKLIAKAANKTFAGRLSAFGEKSMNNDWTDSRNIAYFVGLGGHLGEHTMFEVPEFNSIPDSKQYSFGKGALRGWETAKEFTPLVGETAINTMSFGLIGTASEMMRSMGVKGVDEVLFGRTVKDAKNEIISKGNSLDKTRLPIGVLLSTILTTPAGVSMFPQLAAADMGEVGVGDMSAFLAEFSPLLFPYMGLVYGKLMGELAPGSLGLGRMGISLLQRRMIKSALVGGAWGASQTYGTGGEPTDVLTAFVLSGVLGGGIQGAVDLPIIRNPKYVPEPIAGLNISDAGLQPATGRSYFFPGERQVPGTQTPYDIPSPVAQYIADDAIPIFPGNVEVRYGNLKTPSIFEEITRPRVVDVPEPKIQIIDKRAIAEELEAMRNPLAAQARKQFIDMVRERRALHPEAPELIPGMADSGLPSAADIANTIKRTQSVFPTADQPVVIKRPVFNLADLDATIQAGVKRIEAAEAIQTYQEASAVFLNKSANPVERAYAASVMESAAQSIPETQTGVPVVDRELSAWRRTFDKVARTYELWAHGDQQAALRNSQVVNEWSRRVTDSVRRITKLTTRYKSAFTIAERHMPGVQARTMAAMGGERVNLSALYADIRTGLKDVQTTGTTTGSLADEIIAEIDMEVSRLARQGKGLSNQPIRWRDEDTFVIEAGKLDKYSYVPVFYPKRAKNIPLKWSEVFGVRKADISHLKLNEGHTRIQYDAPKGSARNVFNEYYTLDKTADAVKDLRHYQSPEYFHDQFQTRIYHVSDASNKASKIPPARYQRTSATDDLTNTPGSEAFRWYEIDPLKKYDENYVSIGDSVVVETTAPKYSIQSETRTKYDFLDGDAFPTDKTYEARVGRYVRGEETVTKEFGNYIEARKYLDDLHKRFLQERNYTLVKGKEIKGNITDFAEVMRLDRLNKALLLEKWNLFDQLVNTEFVSPTPKPGWVHIPDDPLSWGNLAGRYVSGDSMRDLQYMTGMRANDDNAVGRFIRQLNSEFKKNKTTRLNPATLMRNAYTQVMYTDFAGVPMHEIPFNKPLAVSYRTSHSEWLDGGEATAWLASTNRLGSSFATGELGMKWQPRREIFQRLAGNDGIIYEKTPMDTMVKMISRLKDADDAAAVIYSYLDEMQKIAMYHYHHKVKGLSLAETGQLIDDFSQMYNKVTYNSVFKLPGGKTWTDPVGIFSPKYHADYNLLANRFLTFNVENTRIQLNALAQNPIKFLKWQLMNRGVKWGSAAAAGLTVREVMETDEFHSWWRNVSPYSAYLPEWAQFHFYDDSTGTVDMLDMTNNVPGGQQEQGAINTYEDLIGANRDPKAVLMRQLQDIPILGEVLFQSPVFNNYAEIVAGEALYSGKKLSDPYASMGEKMLDSSVRLYDNFVPAVMQTWRWAQWKEALTREQKTFEVEYREPGAKKSYVFQQTSQREPMHLVLRDFLGLPVKRFHPLFEALSLKKTYQNEISSAENDLENGEYRGVMLTPKERRNREALIVQRQKQLDEIQDRISSILAENGLEGLEVVDIKDVRE